MPTQTLPLLTRRIRRQDGDDESTLARQWRLLEQLGKALAETLKAANAMQLKKLGECFSAASERLLQKPGNNADS